MATGLQVKINVFEAKLARLMCRLLGGGSEPDMHYV